MSVAVLAVDPGNEESAYALVDVDTRRPVEVRKVLNRHLLERMPRLADRAAFVAIEMVASYGMPVGAEVFETCVWIGRFQQVAETAGTRVGLVYRRDVKLHLCGTSAAKDGNVIQALVDRFARGQRNRGKGTKAEPGWFYGFAKDMWQAQALAVVVADKGPAGWGN